jgi:twitching motility protein PilT
MTAPAQKASEALNLRQLLEEMIERDASDLHVTAGERPKMRVDGEITNSKSEHTLTPKDTLTLAYSVLTENQKKRFENEDELDFSFGIQNLARFRGNCFKQRGCVSMVIRQIPFSVKTFEELGLPKVLQDLSERPRGLVLVTGPTGSGKSTTLAAMIDKINKQERGHIITIEDPIEFIHRHQGCIVNQREVGTDTQSFGAALKYALRQDPDVVLVGEMRDLETIQSALTIAETGHLAFATLHTNSAAESINRIIDVFPAHQQRDSRRHARDPRPHSRRQGAPNPVVHAGGEEARHADPDRLALSALYEPPGLDGRVPTSGARPERILARGRRARPRRETGGRQPPLNHAENS